MDIYICMYIYIYFFTLCCLISFFLVLYSFNLDLLMLLALDVFFRCWLVLFVFLLIKHRPPSSCGYQYYRLPSRILQTIFYHLHLYRQIQWFYRRFVEVVYLSNCYRPSFSAPANRNNAKCLWFFLSSFFFCILNVKIKYCSYNKYITKHLPGIARRLI